MILSHRSSIAIVKVFNSLTRQSFSSWNRKNEGGLIVFQGQYLPSLNVNVVAINKDLEELPPELY